MSHLSAQQAAAASLMVIIIASRNGSAKTPSNKQETQL